MKAKHIFLLGTIISIASLNLSLAQESKRKQTKHDIHAYVEANVFPVLTSQRQALDQLISAEDRIAVDQIREEQKVLRENMKANRPKREEFKQGASPTEEQREAFRAHMKERRLLMTRAWAIADKYETEIDQLLMDLRPQMETWRADIKSLMPDHHQGMEGRKREGMDRREKGHHSHQGRRGGGHRGRKMGFFRQIHSPVGFLLLNPEATVLPFTDENEASSLTVYPNPSTGSTSLSYRLQHAGKVEIQLIDPQGTLVRSKNYDDLQAGNYTEEILTKGLKKGVYVVRIQSNAQIQTQKLVIE
ncbi:MAG: T9SS type A sorting domain-containing protein [Bacteroidota bacterium]